VPERLRTLRAPRAVDPLLSEYVDSLAGGDEGRGRKLFREKSELACCAATKSATRAARFGPKLYGCARARRGHVLDRSFQPHIAAGFRNNVVFLKTTATSRARRFGGARTARVIDADAKLHEVDRVESNETPRGQSRCDRTSRSTSRGGDGT